MSVKLFMFVDMCSCNIDPIKLPSYVQSAHANVHTDTAQMPHQHTTRFWLHSTAHVARVAYANPYAKLTRTYASNAFVIRNHVVAYAGAYA